VICTRLLLVRLLFLLRGGLFILGVHVLFAQLALVERDLARQTVAGLAHLAVEDVAVVFGEESA
jgi:hypothetical protein